MYIEVKPYISLKPTETTLSKLYSIHFTRPPNFKNVKEDQLEANFKKYSLQISEPHTHLFSRSHCGVYGAGVFEFDVIPAAEFCQDHRL